LLILSQSAVPSITKSRVGVQAEIDASVAVALNRDAGFMEETRSAARALATAAAILGRAGQYGRPDAEPHDPDPK